MEEKTESFPNPSSYLPFFIRYSGLSRVELAGYRSANSHRATVSLRRVSVERFIIQISTICLKMRSFLLFFFFFLSSCGCKGKPENMNPYFGCICISFLVIILFQDHNFPNQMVMGIIIEVWAF